MCAKRDDSSTDEIEITREMREAGAAAIFEWRDFSTAWDLAEEVYRAMERKRRSRVLVRQPANSPRISYWESWSEARSRKS